MILWDGVCPTHAALSAEDLRRAKAGHPDARVMVHPECSPQVIGLADCVTGTAGMLVYASSQPAGTEFIVGTEQGMLHRLRQENPRKSFYLAADHLVCPSMKMTTLEDVAQVLEKDQRTVTVESPIRDRARAAVEAMLAIAGRGTGR
jgi:quinolinate synthase